jgi:hypothetical protein
MLSTIQFDCQSRIGTKKMDFHSAPTVKRDRQLNIQAKLAGGFTQCLQPAIQECFAGASRTAHAFQIGRK